MRVLVLAVVLFSALGCSSNKSASDETIYREGKPPVSAVKDSDPELAAATQKAMAELPTFIAECTKELAKAPNQRTLMLSVKSIFVASNGQKEHMWSEVTGFKDGVFSCVLGNEPVYVTNVKQGDAVEIKQSEVEDWIIMDDSGNMRGGYSAKLLLEREEAKAK